jgi:ElaB/YqjD/DUF883 family membrane-anchored ribosome-binding protein
VIAAYLATLDSELANRRVSRRVRRRLLREVDDHLRSDPASLSRFGTAEELAQLTAETFATRHVRRAPWESFAVLAAVGVAFSGILVAWSSGEGPRAAASNADLVETVLAGISLVVAPQLSFVCGLLAILRTWRLRGIDPLPAAEVLVIRRRTSLALGSGLVAAAGLAVAGALPAAGMGASLSAAARSVGAVGSLACASMLLRELAADRVRVAIPGSAGAIDEDGGRFLPRPLRRHPWRLAALVSFTVALPVAVAGAVAGDGYDGALRAFCEAGACLAGFVVLGVPLGLRAAVS